MHCLETIVVRNHQHAGREAAKAFIAGDHRKANAIGFTYDRQPLADWCTYYDAYERQRAAEIAAYGRPDHVRE